MQSRPLITVASKTFRTGLQKLLYDQEDDRWYVSIQNRTYKSIQPIPHDKVAVWKKMLSKGEQDG